MNCFLCKGDAEVKKVTHTVDLGACVVVIRNVPATVCAQCGEVWYTGAVTRELERIVDRVVSAAITEVAIVNYTGRAA